MTRTERKELNNYILENKNDIITKYSSDYDFVGIRIQTKEFKLGKCKHQSKVWVDGKQTREKLNGICVINLKDIERASTYMGDYVAVVCGNEATNGEDYAEIIIEDAMIVEIIR